MVKLAKPEDLTSVGVRGVKLLSSDHDLLIDYAAACSEQWGRKVTPAEALSMCAMAFIRADTEFARAQKAKAK